MNAVKKAQLMDYAEEAIQPASVEDITYIESVEDQIGETNIWLVMSDTQEEYWLLEGCYPANILKKSGILTSSDRAYEVYLETLINLETLTDTTM